jgi:hypothetical protein
MTFLLAAVMDPSARQDEGSASVYSRCWTDASVGNNFVVPDRPIHETILPAT